jgi:hypothetical protein
MILAQERSLGGKSWEVFEEKGFGRRAYAKIESAGRRGRDKLFNLSRGRTGLW